MPNEALHQTGATEPIGTRALLVSVPAGERGRSTMNGTEGDRRRKHRSRQQHLALLGLGSNVGDRDANIRRALECLEAEGAVRVVRVSGFHTTAPVGGPPQGEFRNAAAVVETALPPR